MYESTHIFLYFILFRTNIIRNKYIRECNELGRLAGFLRMFLFLILDHLEVCLKLHKCTELQELQKTFNVRARFIHFGMTVWA